MAFFTGLRIGRGDLLGADDFYMRS
jgi:hypothetical protein